MELAIRLLDETELVLGSGQGEMRVKVAEFKKEEGATAEGSGSAPVAKKDKKAIQLEKEKAGKRAEKLRQYVRTGPVAGDAR